MNKVKLSKICDFNVLNAPSNLLNSEIEYLDTGSITNNTIINIQKFAKGVHKPSRAKRLVRLNDIIVSLVRPNQKHFGFIDESRVNLVVSSGFATITVRDKSVDPRYLFYVISLDDVTNHLSKIASTNTSSYPSINPEDLLNLEILLHESHAYQKKLGQFFTNIDALIDLNLKRIKDIRNMINLIYEDIFVNFTFFSVSKKFANLLPLEFEFSDPLNRKIPKGWVVENILNNSLFNIIQPGINPFNNEKFYLSTSSVDVYSIDRDSEKIKYKDRETRANMQPTLYSVWFAKMKNTKKFLFFSSNDTETVSNTILSTGFFGVQSTTETFEYCACVIDSKEFEERKNFLANGATQEAISQQALAYIPVLIPPKEILEVFHSQTESYFQMITQLQQNNLILNSSKNDYLKSLVSGEISLID